MKEAIKSAPRIDEEVAGSPVEAHGYVVTPIARVRGMVGSREDEQASGRYGWAAIQPVRMTIQTLHGQDRDKEVREVRLVDIEGQALKALALAGAIVTVVSLLISVLARVKK